MYFFGRIILEAIHFTYSINYYRYTFRIHFQDFEFFVCDGDSNTDGLKNTYTRFNTSKEGIPKHVASNIHYSLQTDVSNTPIPYTCVGSKENCL